MQVEDLLFISHQWLELSFTGSCAGCSDETIRFLLRNDRGGGGERGMTKVAK